MRERLQKILAASGIASRRKAEEIITAGRVMVNGKLVNELGARADAAVDTITVDGKELVAAPRVVYALNKPRGVISTRADEQGRETVTQLVPSDPPVFPVGRLDADSEGLLLLTNDGALTDRLTHPKYEHEKEYEIIGHTKRTPEGMTDRFQRGAQLKDGVLVPDKVEFAGLRKNQLIFRITVHEGRNHLIRRLASRMQFEITRLRRIRIGAIQLGDLAPGKYRQLSDSEIRQLEAGQPSD